MAYRIVKRKAPIGRRRNGTIAETMRAALSALKPDHCIEWKGCRKNLYDYAKQLNMRIATRRNPDGTFHIWRIK